MMGRRRMSGVKLAARIGRTQSYVSRRLTAEVAFDLDDLERIADVFDMSFAQLMARIDAEISWLMPRSMPSVGIADSENGENVTQPVDLDAYRARKHAKPINSALQAARVG